MTAKSTAALMRTAPPMSAKGGAATWPQVPFTPQPSTSWLAFPASSKSAGAVEERDAEAATRARSARDEEGG